MVSSPLPDEDDHSARHPDPAEQQRDQAHQPEVTGEPAERVVQVRLVLGDRANPHALGQEQGAVALGEGLRRHARGQPHERLVLGAGTESQQARPGQVPRGDVDARPERRADPDVARRTHDRAADHEAALAERERVAQPGVECREERRIDHHPVSLRQLAPRGGGLGADLAVERVAALDGGDLHQPGTARPRHISHPGEAREPGDRAAPRDERVEDRLRGLGQRAARRQREVGAEKGPGLAPDRIAQVVGEAADGHERGHADRDRGREQEQPPWRRADLPRRHAEHEGDGRQAGLTRRCRRRWRRQPGGWCAGPARRDRDRV